MVLFAADFGRPDPTGLGRYADTLARELLGRTGPLRYRLAGSPSPAGRPVVAGTAGAAVAGTSGAPVAPGAIVERPPWPRRALHLSWSALHRPQADRFLGRPDLIHLLYPSTPVPSRARLVCTVHDLFPMSHPQWFGPKERWLFGAAVRYAAERADRLIANSAHTAAECTARLGVEPSRMEVIPLGVDDRFFGPLDATAAERVAARFGVRPGEYLIVVGSVSVRKNLAPVLEAAAATGMPLVAAGPPGPGYEDTVRLAERLETAVRWTGWLPEGELHGLLSGALALLHPATVEGFGLTPLEAMAAGVPTAVSRGGSLPEVTGGASLLVDPADPAAWAEVMGRFGDDAGLRADLIGRGRSVAAGYRWADVAERTAAVHRRVLGI